MEHDGQDCQIKQRRLFQVDSMHSEMILRRVRSIFDQECYDFDQKEDDHCIVGKVDEDFETSKVFASRVLKYYRLKI